MIVIPAPARDDALFSVIETWVGLLADGNYRQACGLLWNDPDQPNWTAALLAEVFDGYAKLEGRGRVTRVADARVTDYAPDLEVDWWVGETGQFAGDVHYSLPFDGVWSNVMAMFNICRVPGGFALELDDIHVL